MVAAFIAVGVLALIAVGVTQLTEATGPEAKLDSSGRQLCIEGGSDDLPDCK